MNKMFQFLNRTNRCSDAYYLQLFKPTARSFNSSIGLTAVLTSMLYFSLCLIMTFQFLNRTNRCSDANSF